MNQKKTGETRDAEVQGIEVIDFGNAMMETRQGAPIPQFLDSCCSYAYWAE